MELGLPTWYFSNYRPSTSCINSMEWLGRILEFQPRLLDQNLVCLCMCLLCFLEMMVNHKSLLAMKLEPARSTETWVTLSGQMMMSLVCITSAVFGSRRPAQVTVSPNALSLHRFRRWTSWCRQGGKMSRKLRNYNPRKERKLTLP